MTQDSQAWLQTVQQHMESGQTDLAISLCQQRLAQFPDDADALHVMGWLAYSKGDRASAESLIRRAVSIRPAAPIFHNTLGVILASDGKNDPAALEEFNTAIRLAPNFAHAHGNLGEFHYRRNHLDQAIDKFTTAITLGNDPSHYQALAAALALQGRQQDVLEIARRAIEIQPNRADLYHNLLYYMWIADGLDRATIVEQHKVWGDMAQHFVTPHSRRPHDNNPDPNRKLRVGYVSPDLREHVIGYFMAPILAAHDPARVETFCYFNGNPDRMTQALKSHAHHWIDTHAMDDDALAERVRADGIDILIDLSLHMAYTRLMLFVKKPAPVQATYLSYPGTSGLPQMDYRITDRFLEPEDRTDGWLGPEKLARLDPCYWCYRMPPEAPDVGDIPSEQAGHITFACTNNFMKVTPRALELWSEILKQVPNSKLRCYLRGGPENSQDVIEAFSEAAIDPKRVELRDQLPYAQYLAAYNEIDIALDPFPYNGGTTTFDALYMGVPVVTLAGELPMGRFGVTIMENLSLQDLIATSPNDYITRAVQLAQNIQRRIDLRKSLRPKLQSSHLTNATQFTRQLENLYQWMWQQWCAKPHP